MQAHPKSVLITLLPFCRSSQPCAGSATCFFPVSAVRQVRGILYPHRSCLDLYRFIHCHFSESSPVPLSIHYLHSVSNLFLNLCGAVVSYLRFYVFWWLKPPAASTAERRISLSAPPPFLNTISRFKSSTPTPSLLPLNQSFLLQTIISSFIGAQSHQSLHYRIPKAHHGSDF